MAGFTKKTKFFYVRGQSAVSQFLTLRNSHKSNITSKLFVLLLNFLNFKIIENFDINFIIEKVIRSSPPCGVRKWGDH